MRNRKGQITVLVLLLSMLGLLVGLSAVSRSLSDLKQVTYVDSGTRALAAAEAGLQYGFANLSTFSPDADCSNPTFHDVTSLLPLAGIKTLSFAVCSATKNSITVPNVQQDDVVEVDFTGVQPSLKSFDVSWRGGASVEIEVIDKDNSGVYSMRRYAYNANGQTRSNGFASGLPGSSCNGGGSVCDSSFGGATDSCTGYGEICYEQDCSSGNTTAQLVRIKPLYQSSDISLCGRAAGKSQVGFNLQYYQVIAVATTTNGSVRKLQADRYPPALPAVFDNVFYSGGDIVK